MYIQYIVSNISAMKSGGAHVSTSCLSNPGLLYNMLTFHMILMHDQQTPLTTPNYILCAPQPSCNIQHAKIYDISMSYRRERKRKTETEKGRYIERKREKNVYKTI